MRGLSTIAGVVAVAACSAAPSPAPSPVRAPAVIEASPDASPRFEPLREAAAKACAEAVPPADGACTSGVAGTCMGPCLAGDPEACTTLGSELHASDAACATALWSAACERDDATACTQLAEHVVDVEQRVAAATKACEGKRARGCRILGELRVGSDEDEAAGHFDRACELGDAIGCLRAGQHYAGGNRDRVVASERYERGCNLGEPTACRELAMAFFTGSGVTRDLDRGLQLMDQVCRMDGVGDGGKSCEVLAQVAQSGRVPGLSGGAAANSLYERACEKGQLNACEEVGQKHYAAARYADAIRVATPVIAAEPDRWVAYYVRGLSRFDTGAFAEAAADLDKLCPLRSSWQYCPLWLYAAQMRAGRDGRPALEQHAIEHANGPWPEPVLRFYLGKLSEPALVRVAGKPKDAKKKNEQLCEAYYYIAQKHVIEGRTKAAARMFQKTLDTGVTNFVEYASARAELSRQSAKP
jgi:TPR repeat protein